MPVQTQHCFSVIDYYRMTETGVLRPDARVELLDGKIIDMSPIGAKDRVQAAAEVKLELQ